MDRQELSGGRLRVSRVVACLVLGVLAWLALTVAAQAAPVIVNEYNAVASGKYLDNANYSGALNPIKEDSYFRTIPGLPDGRIQGNGGNWIELLVVQDHLDMRGFQLRWAEPGNNPGDTNGSDIWYGNGTVEQGTIRFSDTAPIWSDLRAGSIITLSEKASIGVDTTLNAGNRNFTNNVAPGDVDVTINLATDTSYDPAHGDWWIHVSGRGEAGNASPLITTLTNVTGGGPGDFSVGEADWQMRIVNGTGSVVYGPVGEAIAGWGGGGINDRKAGRFEMPLPSDQWTLANWGSAGPADYDSATSTSFGQPNAWGTPEQPQDLSALRALIPEPGTAVMLLSAGVSLLLFWRRIRPR